MSKNHSKSVGSKRNLGQKKLAPKKCWSKFRSKKLWVQKILDPKNFREKNVCQNKCLTKKMFGQKKLFTSRKFWVQKNFSRKYFGSDELWVRKKYWFKTIFGPTKFGVQQHIGSTKILGQDKIWGPKNFRRFLSDLANPNFTWPVLTWFDLIQIEWTYLDRTWPVLTSTDLT